jgi:predicted transcriptional regulator
MAKSIRVTEKKRRGRPATTGAGTQIGERWHDAELAAIDAWIASTGETLTRGQAIRRLVELGLKSERSAKPASKTGRRSRAAELAAKQIERMIDPSAPSEERDRRLRQLTKGPLEFREDRVDLPKAKK